MTFWGLATRGLLYHRRSYLSLALALSVAGAVFSGALFMGDSLQVSLQQAGLRRLGPVASAAFLSRPVPKERAAPLPDVYPVLYMQGSVSVESTSGNEAYAAGINVWGLDERTAAFLGLSPWQSLWLSDQRQAVVAERLGQRLGIDAGSRIRLSIERHSTLPRNTLLARRSLDDVTVTATFTVACVLPSESPVAELALTPQMGVPLNLFVPYQALWDLVQDKDATEPLVTLLLSPQANAVDLTHQWRQALRLEDYGLRLRLAFRTEGWIWSSLRGYVSVESDRLIIDDDTRDRIIAAARSIGVTAEPTLVYLIHSISYQNREIPYALIAGVNPEAAAPLGPFHTLDGKPLRDGDIALLEWDESPLRDLPADGSVSLTLTYYHPEVEGEGRIESQTLRFCGYLPRHSAAGDRYLTPVVKGITDQGTHPRDWDRPPQLTNAQVRQKIRAGDVHDRFWQRYGATPKAFVTLTTAQRLFGSRYGSTTSVRVASTELPKLEQALLTQLDPVSSGLAFVPLRADIQAASTGAVAFSGLFLAFSTFLIIASLLLIILIFRLIIEQRVTEIGLLSATGFAVKDIMHVLLVESLLICIAGAAAGLIAGLLYCLLILRLLSALWPQEDLQRLLGLHPQPMSFVSGFVVTVLLGWISQWQTLRRLVRVPAPALLRGSTEVVDNAWPQGRWRGAAILAVVGLGSALVLSTWGGRADNPEEQALGFFTAGLGVLVSGLAGWYALWRTGGGTRVRGRGWPGLIRLSWRSLTRWHTRSMLTAGLLAAAVYLLVAVESFRRQPETDVWNPSSGSGGFNLIGECVIPVHDPFTSGPGRSELEARLQAALGGSSEEIRYQQAVKLLDRIEVAFLRLRSGDDVSCSNLYQVQRPRILAVPAPLIERGGFRFGRTLATTPEERANPWLLLRRTYENGEVPVFCEQDTAQWKFFTEVGGLIELTRDDGTPLRCRLVGTLVNSPFVGELLMADEHFRRVFPQVEGYRFFLIRTLPQDEAATREVLELGLRSQGLQIVRTTERLQQALSIVSTYLSTFQILGALGLLLGVGGLSVVVFRNVWERLAEWALLSALGYRLEQIRTLVLLEHLFLFANGVLLGLVAAALAVLPHLRQGGRFPWSDLGLLLLVIVACGVFVIVWSSNSIARLRLLSALRNE